MNQSTGLTGSRAIALTVVAMLHLGVIALLVLAPERRLASVAAPLELLLIAPASAPKVRLEHVRPGSLSAHVLISPLPPGIDPSGQARSPSLSSGDNGINWAAEARRAVKAYEIRRDTPRSNVIEGASREEWWLQQPHHAGDKYKTESGDWIVWIDANCYQIASWHAGDPTTSAPPLHTICPNPPAGHSPRADGKE